MLAMELCLPLLLFLSSPWECTSAQENGPKSICVVELCVPCEWLCGHQRWPYSFPWVAKCPLWMSECTLCLAKCPLQMAECPLRMAECPPGCPSVQLWVAEYQAMQAKCVRWEAQCFPVDGWSHITLHDYLLGLLALLFAPPASCPTGLEVTSTARG